MDVTSTTPKTPSNCPIEPINLKRLVKLVKKKWWNNSSAGQPTTSNHCKSWSNSCWDRAALKLDRKYIDQIRYTDTMIYSINMWPDLYISPLSYSCADRRFLLNIDHALWSNPPPPLPSVVVADRGRATCRAEWPVSVVRTVWQGPVNGWRTLLFRETSNITSRLSILLNDCRT